MATARARVIHLSSETYEALENEAERRHVAPDELADEIVRTELQPAEREPGYLNDWLEKMEALSATMPAVDAVELVRQGREELEQRSLRWLQS